MSEHNKRCPEIYWDMPETDFLWNQKTYITIEDVEYEVEYNQQHNQFDVTNVIELQNIWFEEEGYTWEEACPFMRDQEALYKAVEDILQERYYESI